MLFHSVRACRHLVEARTNMFHEATVRSNVLSIRKKIEFEWILLSTVFSNKGLLLLYHTFGLGSEDDSGIDELSCCILMSLPQVTSDLHVFVEGQALALPITLIGTYKRIQSGETGGARVLESVFGSPAPFGS